MTKLKRRSWHLLDRNYSALYVEARRRGLSDNSMLNEIIREWREAKVNHSDTKSVQPTCTDKQ